MKRRYWIILAGLALFSILVLSRGPIYKGRSVRTWFDEFEKTNGKSRPAAEALQALGSKAVPYLVDELTRRNRYREAYLNAAWKLPPAVRDQVPQWRNIPWTRRHYATEALGLIGPSASNAVPALIASLSWTEPFLARTGPGPGQPSALGWTWFPRARVAAVEALWRIAPDSEQVVAALIQASKDRMYPRSDVGEAAARVLSQLNPRFKDQIPLLIENLRYQDQKQYRGGISSIVKTGPGYAASIPQLAKALHDSNKEIREAAAYDLSVFHPKHLAVLRKLIPDLTEALADSEARVRLRAAEALIVISSDRPPALAGCLQELLGIFDDDFAIRLRACEALRKLGASATNAVPMLRSHLNDPASIVRTWAAEALKTIQSAGEKAESPIEGEQSRDGVKARTLL